MLNHFWVYQSDFAKTKVFSALWEEMKYLPYPKGKGHKVYFWILFKNHIPNRYIFTKFIYLNKLSRPGFRESAFQPIPKQETKEEILSPKQGIKKKLVLYKI